MLALSNGLFRDTLAFSVNGLVSKLGMELTIKPIIQTDSTSLHFGSGLSSRTFQIKNIGRGYLPYRIHVAGEQTSGGETISNWVTTSDTIGKLLAGQSKLVTVTLDRTKMPASSLGAYLEVSDSIKVSGYIHVFAEEYKTMPFPKAGRYIGYTKNGWGTLNSAVVVDIKSDSTFSIFSVSVRNGFGSSVRNWLGGGVGKIRKNTFGGYEIQYQTTGFYFGGLFISNRIITSFYQQLDGISITGGNVSDAADFEAVGP